MKAAAAALLSFVLAGCAPAARTVQPRAPAAPVSQWEDGAGEDTASAPEEAAIAHLAEARAALLGALPPGMSGQEASGEPFALGGLDPEVIHRARIEMARAALVEENENKERVDLAEELQRELAALQAGPQTSKSRVKHGGPTKKQP